jgi:prophage antirepressor-like protein
MEKEGKLTGNMMLFFGNHCVSVYVKHNEPWFLVKDVGRMLGIKNIRQRLKYVAEDLKGVCFAYTLGGKQTVSVVNDVGLYRLIFESHTKEAEKFKDWIAKDVLPAIMRTGKYEHRKRMAGNVLAEKSMSDMDMLRIVMKEYPGHVTLLEWIEPDSIPAGKK